MSGERRTLGTTIRGLRVARCLSQSRLARLVGVDDTYVSHLEHDRRDPSLSTLRLIATALGVPAAELFAAAAGSEMSEPSPLPAEGDAAERERLANLATRLRGFVGLDVRRFSDTERAILAADLEAAAAALLRAGSAPAAGGEAVAPQPSVDGALWFRAYGGDVYRFQRARRGEGWALILDPDDVPESLAGDAPDGWSVFRGEIRKPTEDEDPHGEYESWWAGDLVPATGATLLAFFGLQPLGVLGAPDAIRGSGRDGGEGADA